MAENKDGQDKTEPASGKRLNEARSRGQVSKSQDVTTVSVMLFGGLAVYKFGSAMMENLQQFMKHMLYSSSSIKITEQSVPGLYLDVIGFISKVLFPILISIFAIVLATEISQVGFKFATKKFTEGLNFKQIFNPISGIKKIFFSGRSAFELVKSFGKLILIGSIVYQILSRRTTDTVSFMERPFSDIGAYIAEVSLELLLKISSVYLIIAVVDYFYQRYKFKEDMKMTKFEVKEESKQSEGDPKIKARLRSIMKQRIRKLMLKNVRTADVVITNPTHFAVAVSYKPGKMNAPVVVAKGVDYLALNIREIANDNNIPIVEEPPLARTLYFSVQVEQEIPENLFKAVAQILAFVYHLKHKRA